jgi:hypothetical protein
MAEDWDSWHTLVLTDEISRVVRPHFPIRGFARLTKLGIHRRIVGFRWW